MQTAFADAVYSGTDAVDYHSCFDGFFCKSLAGQKPGERVKHGSAVCLAGKSDLLFYSAFAVMNCLPDNSYRKYIQYYMGRSHSGGCYRLLHLSGMEGQIAAYTKEFQEEAQEWEEKAETWEREWQEEAGIIEGQEVVP